MRYEKNKPDCFICFSVNEALLDGSYEKKGCATCSRYIVLRSSWDDVDCSYCDLCFTSNDLFGCIGIRSKKYCILNRQYSKEEYIELKNKIINQMKENGEWGEYVPASISMFSYNESVAQEYFPLSREEALSKGYKWYDRPKREYKITKNYNDLPETIEEIDDSIVDEIIQCKSQLSQNEIESNTECTTAFKITKEELILYRKIGVPIREKCFTCRRQDRFALRSPRKLWHRLCMKEGCTNEFETSYAPERPEIVYCESCYQQEVV